MSVGCVTRQNEGAKQELQLQRFREFAQFKYVEKLIAFNRPIEATSHIYQVVGLSPKSFKHYALAMKCLDGLVNQEKFTEAVDAANRLLEKFPEGNFLGSNEHTHFKCASKLIEINRPVDALPHVYKILELDPNNFEYYTIALKCLARLVLQEKFLEAIDVANHLLKKFPEDHSVLLHRAQSYLGLADTVDALEDVYSILSERSDDEEALQIFHRVEQMTGRTYPHPFRRV